MFTTQSQQRDSKRRNDDDELDTWSNKSSRTDSQSFGELFIAGLAHRVTLRAKAMAEQQLNVHYILTKRHFVSVRKMLKLIDSLSGDSPIPSFIVEDYPSLVTEHETRLEELETPVLPPVVPEPSQSEVPQLRRSRRACHPVSYRLRKTCSKSKRDTAPQVDVTPEILPGVDTSVQFNGLMLPAEACEIVADKDVPSTAESAHEDDEAVDQGAKNEAALRTYKPFVPISGNESSYRCTP